MLRMNFRSSSTLVQMAKSFLETEINFFHVPVPPDLPLRVHKSLAGCELLQER